MTLALASCAASSSGVREIVRRDIPAPPPYLNPVTVPDPRKGESLAVVAGRERAGRIKANRIILGARSQWEKMRKTYQRTR